MQNDNKRSVQAMRFKFLGCGFLGSKFLNCIDMKNFRKKLNLFHQTFFYNELNDTDSITEIAFNPFFWFVDNFAYYFGIVSVFFFFKILSYSFLFLRFLLFLYGRLY
jgi:uncharacterized membrane protein SpoIIM required for sporulation